ncbi:MAG: ATP-binding cassette domain-containing protein [Clostridia bacterium]|nr:ATP-binding cassette domain-containing protein [Clostridia bacterium]
MGKRERMMQALKEPKPESIREVPGYLYRLITKFFYRLFYIFRIVWETKPWILFFMVFMALWNGVTPVISSFIGAELLNSLAAAYVAATTGLENQFDNVVKLLIIRFSYNFITGVVSRISHILNNIASELVVNHVNLKIMYKSREVDLASFDLPDFYEKFEDAKREAGNRPIQILNNNFTIISTVISMLSYVVILGAISPWAPLIIVAMSVPTAIINFSYRKKNFHYVRWHSKERRQMNYYSGLMTNKDMVKEIRIFNLSDLFIGRYQETFLRYFGGLKRLFVGEGLWNICLTVITTTVNCLLFLHIAWGVAQGRYEVGDYSLYTGALSHIASGIGTIISTTASIYEGTLFIDNLIAFMNEKRTIVPALKEPRRVKHHEGHTIVFENVSFSYPGTDRKVINNVNLTLDPGDTCVLVGLNGAGKTTLIKLLTRLYDPTEGRILLDGYDIREYAVEDLYSMFGIIFQDFGKYAVNVRENIQFGQIERETVEEEIMEAAQQSSADIFINDLPDKYDTPLMRIFEDNGIELSIGQWQKLSIARAFYSDSDVIILDEPTASLDAIAEQEIYNQFDKLRKDKTTIFVSHRLSSATVANKIVVLEHGAVIEIGDHSELMKKKGLYYELFTTQAKRYLTTIDGESAEQFMAEGGVLLKSGEDQPDGEHHGHHGHHGRPPFGEGRPPKHGERPPFGEGRPPRPPMNGEFPGKPPERQENGKPAVPAADKKE